MLHNRAIVGGFGVLVVLLLVAVVLVVVGEGGADIDTLSASRTEVPNGVSTVTATRGLAGRVNITATVRRGPGSSYTPMGTIPRASVVSVIGRSDDDLWLQIVYPRGSRLLGWVQTAWVNVEGDIGELNVAGAGEGPSVAVPTGSVPVVTEPPIAPLAPSATPAEPPTPSMEPATRTPRPTRTTIPSVTPRTSPTPTTEEPGTATPEAGQ